MKGLSIFPFVSFLVLVVLISGKIILLKRKGIKVSSGLENKNSTLVFLYPVFLLIFFTWLAEVARPAFQLSFSLLPEMLVSLFVQSVLLNVVGIVIVSSSLVFLTFTLHHFRNSLRFGLNEDAPGKLITTGIFSISRNPFFLSLNLYFLGIAFLLPSLFLIGFAILSIVGIHFFILKEEKFMYKVYGWEYQKYTEEVRRYF